MRNLKKILAFVLAMALTLSLAFLMTACGEDEKNEEPCTSHLDENKDSKCDKCGVAIENNNKTVYTVTVIDENNQKVEGVKIKLTSGSNSSGTGATDANGKASLEIEAEGAVFANVESLPEGYVASDTKVAFDKGSVELTIKVKKSLDKTFAVTVLDNEGKAIKDVYVQICEGESCRNPMKTNSNGIAEFKFTPNGTLLKARVLILPEGYSYSGNENAEGYVYFDEGATEITLVLNKAA